MQITSRARWLFGVLAGALLVAVVPVTPAAAELHGIRGTYGEIRRDDGHVDTPATISRLRELNANTYLYFVDGQQDWDDLRFEFAQAAQAAGINVWVYLRSPSECRDSSCDYLPYRHRYEDWACAIAQLSRQYPVVAAWVMDDFASNQDYITPGYLQEIRRLSTAIQPTLKFYPVVYFNYLDARFLDSYATLVDALVMPYRDDPYRNLLYTGSLRGQLNNASALLARYSRKLLLMVYAGGLSHVQVLSDVDYVRRVTTTGMEYNATRAIAGVIQYALELRPGRPKSDDRNLSRSPGRGALVATVQGARADGSGAQRTSAGDWAGGRTRLRFDTGSSRCLMRFWHADNRTVPTPTGYHFKQALVDGVVVWERDAASDGTDWLVTTLDLTSTIQPDGGVDLLLRLFEKQGVENLHIRAVFDDITFTGCHVHNDDPSFEQPGTWSILRHGGPVIAGQHIYDPVFSTNAFAAVSRLYG